MATLTATSGYQGAATGPINGTIGASTPNSGVFTTLTATSGYQGAINGPFNGTIGASTPNSVVATSVITTSGGQITGYLTGAIGANTANTGAFTTLTTTGNVGVGGISAGSAGYRFALQGYAASAVPLYLHSDATNAYLYSPNPVYMGSTGANPTVLVSNNTERLRIDSGGNVGISTSSPITQLHLNASGYAAMYLGNNASTGFHLTKESSDNSFNIWSGTFGSGTNRFKIDSSGNTQFAGNVQIASLGIGTAASGTAGEIRATNNVTAYYSDDRLKRRLGNIENALEKLVSLNGFNYQPNRLAQSLGYALKDEVGVSAQEVQKVLPSAVVPAPIDDKYLTVHYDRLIPLLIEAIKELTAKVERLEGK